MMNRDSHRFRLKNTWCIDTSRQPNWLLSDLKTGKEYRYFLLVEAEEQIRKLSGRLVADTGARYRNPAEAVPGHKPNLRRSRQ